MSAFPALKPQTTARTAARGPFRAEHVGSLLRPEFLLRARQRFAAGEMSRPELTLVEDAAIVEAAAFQESIGLKSISDGEFRRSYFHLDFLLQIQGLEAYQDQRSTHFHKATGEVFDFSPPKLRATGKLARSHPILRRDYQSLAGAITGPGVAKITLPSPTMAFRGGRAAISQEAYPELDAFFEDLADVYRREIADLVGAGCRYLQLDDTNLAYLCDHGIREAARNVGDDPDDLPIAYARTINACLRDVPAEVVTSIHLCRGNFKSAYVAEGGYDPVAEVLFNAIEVDAFFLEYDDARSGDFAPLRYLPKEKSVVLGLVSSKSAELESSDELKRRIDEAARFAPLEQLCLSPQCGFASTEHGNDLSPDDQRQKLELVVQTACEVWGE